MNNIKNIVFDMGGVLFNFDFEGANRIFAQLGINLHSDPRRGEVLIILNDYINGFLTEEEFAHLLLNYCHRGVTVEAILARLQCFSGNLPAGRLQTLVELRKTYRIFLLSNINERMWRWTLDLMASGGYTPSECFDAVFLSYEMQLAKPDPRIYQRMITETGIVPQETLYFDDLKENIEAGAALGLQSHIVKANALETCEAYCKLAAHVTTAQQHD